ncbi:cell envelope biogenesis protein OmpA [Candidatus Poribacteria bacterium]|nr:MAG: cell envelope biogenesis protein OmpA [Candidatus Poribacteria bacterium]
MIDKLFNRKNQETEEHWVSISDVMAGLMVIFLFIAISYMVNANRETERFKRETEELNRLKEEVASLIDVYRNSQRAVSEEFQREFGDDMETWTGSLFPETLSIRFKKPFAQGKAEVPNSFKSVLQDFFPRYIEILTKSEYIDKIAEIRIEGHTSSEWFEDVGVDLAYYHNMELSQDRARNVLQYVLEIRHSDITQNKEWIKEYLTANGLSSSKLILYSDGSQNKEASRRVEFRVVTKSEKLIEKIKALMEEFDKEGEVK